MKALIIIILACALVSSCCTPCCDDVNPFEKNQICEDLKQSIYLNSLRGMPDDEGRSPIVRAYLYKEYERYHCSELLDEQ